MKKIANFIVRIRHILLVIFIFLVLSSAFLIPKVKTNYDMTKYLDPESVTTIALKKMDEEFGSSGTAQIMIVNEDLESLNELLLMIESIEGVDTVVFDPTSESYYHDDKALFKVFLENSNYDVASNATVHAIREALSDYEVALNGGSVSSAFLSDAVLDDMVVILIVASIIVFLILTLTSSSWVEPIMFTIVVAGSIIINLGTNIFLGEISYITKSICAVMQLALAMDYSIIFLHRFNECKNNGLNNKEATAEALAETIIPVSSSSLTTIAGLAALMFMSFTIGYDVGMVLVKGVLISLLSVFLFMPGILILFAPLLEKTQHRSIQEIIANRRSKRKEKKGLEKKDVNQFVKFQYKSRIIIPIIVLGLIIIGGFFQSKSSFSYALETSNDENLYINVEDAMIEESFGIQNSIVVMVPKGDIEKEKELFTYLSNYQLDGKEVISSGQSLSSTGLNDTVSIMEMAKLYDIPLEELKVILGILDIDINKKLVLSELIKDISLNDKVKDLSLKLQNKVDEINEEMQILFADLTMKDTRDLIEGLSAIEVFGMFTAINKRIPTSSSTVKTYEIIEYAHELGNEDVALYYEAYQKAITPITKELLINNLNLSEDLTEIIFEYFNLTEGIKVHELLETASEMKMVNEIGNKLQEEVDLKYEDVLYAFKMFESENYTRLIFNLELGVAEEEAFVVIEDLREGINDYYEESYILSESANSLDIKKSFDKDVTKINSISFFAILIILMLTFRSLSVPVLLTVLIQGAIWISMSFNYVIDEPIFFIAYLLVMCIQMGATVDYAILLTSRYLEARKDNNKLKSMNIAFNASIMTILTSGSILVVAATVVGLVSNVAIISTLGLLLARGCLISVILVVFALPQILLLCDKLILKTTMGINGKKETMENKLFSL